MLDLPGDIARLRTQTDTAIVAIGNNTLRETLTDKLMQAGFELASVIHPRAIVGTEANLGRGVIVNCGAIVDHHAQAEDFGHLGVNACMAGRAKLGKRAAWLQAGVALGYGANMPPGMVLVCAPASNN